MNYVFVLDTNKQPLNPVRSGWARKLLSSGRAAVYKRYPFTIILKVATQNADIQPLRLKIDPGSKTTGIAIVNDGTSEVVFATEVQHRGQRIKKVLDSRRASRRSRRNRKTRYRQPRFSNRTRPEGWLPPSLTSRVANIETWVKRLCFFCPIVAISCETAKFDMQKMQNPEISGVEYQQGELQGYEVKEYLLEKFGRKCVYCGKDNVPVEVEHIVPKSRNGSNRVSNLTLSCVKCNQKKSTQTAEEFGYPEVQKQAKKTLKDAAVLNSTRKALIKQIGKIGLPLEIGTGALTKYNRAKRKLPKTHWIDAVCVGASTPKTIELEGIYPISIIATGHGSRQICSLRSPTTSSYGSVDKYGFPRTKAKQFKRVHGFQSGDMVKATVKTGKKAGTYIGRVAVRTSGSFNLKTASGTVQGISYRYCQLLQRTDGYSYE